MSLSEDKKRKLQELADLRDPASATTRRAGESIQESLKNLPIMSIPILFKGEQGEPGEPGYTPEKGKDYFTAEEIDAIVAHIQSQVKDGAPGKNGENGAPGKTPIKGADYYTKEEREELLRDLLKQVKIPKPQDGLSPKIEDIVVAVTAKMGERKISFKDITDIKDLVEFLKRGGFRGGGGSGGGSGGGDVSSNTATSVDSEVALFSGTGGKTIKRATGTGIARLTSGVLSVSKVALTEPATSATLTIADGKTLTVNDDITLTGGPISKGDLLTGNASSAFIITAVGSDGKVLTADAASTGGVKWSTPAAGTVTATGGALTANSVVLGAGTTDTKVVAGITTDGTSILNLGVNTTTIGKIKLFGNTSGDVTILPNAVAGTATTFTLPATSGTAALTANKLSVFAATTSAELAGVISDETGSGALVFATSPTLTTAVLGSSTATTQTPADNSTKVATTAYVDAAVLGQNFKEAAGVATTTNLVGIYLNGSSGVGATFTYTATGVDTIDGVTLTLGMRVLLKNQTSTFQNGIYTVTTAGAIGIAGILTRTGDADQAADWKTGDSIFVTAGTTQTTTTWAYTGADSPTMGTDAITFAQTAGQGSFTAGNGITITGVSIAIDTSVTVDKTTAQTLTNKTLTAPVMTAPVLGTPASGVATNLTGLPAAAVLAGTLGTGAYTMDTSLTVPQIFNTPSAVTATSNAATVTRANRNWVVTNNSAAGITITLSTSGAAAGDMIKIKSLPSSAVAQAITWVNTEVSDITPSANLNASTTSPRTDGFEWNPLTSKWRCIASC